MGKAGLSSTSAASKRIIDTLVKTGKRTIEFAFIPNSGFLNSNLPLVNDCELKLSFDRVNAEVAMLENSKVIKQTCVGSPLVIKDCCAIAEYVSSDKLEKHFAKIDYSPIPYHYEECEVTLKTIPLNEKEVRLDNITGGDVPNVMFAGIIESAALNGDIEASSTHFACNNVTEFNITLNGNSVNGYPIENRRKIAVYPFYKFMDVTKRYMNPLCGEGLKLSTFKYNWLYAHSFEAESSSQGWIGVNFKMDTAFTTPHTLVIWTIKDCALTVDKFHQIEKVEL